MGEAKNRKLNDRTYGRIPKGGYGVVLTPNVSLGPGNIVNSEIIDPLTLRRSLLLSDKICIPKNNAFRLPDTPEDEFLKAAGILDTPVVPHPGGPLDRIFREVQTAAFELKDGLFPGRWAMADFETIDELPERGAVFTPGRGCLITLQRAIPVPVGETSLEDVLHFKEKHRDEIVELQIELNSIYDRILNSADSDMALSTALTSIGSKCDAAIRVAAEAPIKFRLSDVGLGFAIPISTIFAIANGGLLSQIIAGGVHLPGMNSIASSLLPLISVQAGFGLKRRNWGDSPFRVIGKAHGELGFR